MDSIQVTGLEIDELDFVGTIIALAQGAELGIPGFEFSEVTDKNEAWRTQMLEYVSFAIVAVAQHLSRQFGGRDVRIDGKIVIPWTQPVKEEVFTKGPPDYTMSYGSGGSLGAWKVDSPPWRIWWT